MKRSAGFTLIELIIVIVILGILAVTAVPKFINFQNDARAASIKTMGGSISSAAAMVYSKAIIANADSAAAGATGASVSINGNTIELAYGYPTATSANMTALLDGFNTTDWTATAGTGSTPQLTIVPTGFSGSSCQIVYTQATGKTSPATVSITSSGC